MPKLPPLENLSILRVNERNDLWEPTVGIRIFYESFLFFREYTDRTISRNCSFLRGVTYFLFLDQEEGEVNERNRIRGKPSHVS